MNTHYIIFDRTVGPGKELPVGVYDTLPEAEANQLNLQQDMAASYNNARHAAFTRGDEFLAAKDAADYKNALHITEVLTP